MRMVAALIAIAVLSGYPEDLAAARADWSAYGPSARYLTLHGDTDREQLGRSLRYAIAHLSREQVLDNQFPTPITPTLVRIDLDLLGWGYNGWCKLAEQYPYSTAHDPLIIDGRWLLATTSDAQASTAYYDLLYAGTKTPTTKAEFFKVWGVDLNASKASRVKIIIDEGKSGVSRFTRELQGDGTANGDHWQSFDSVGGAGKRDPLENPSGGLVSDAQEFIAAIPKVDLRTGQRSRAQAYFLTDGKGNRVDFADPRIVEDRTNFRRVPHIRTPGSCICCHGGLNGPAQNLLRDYLAKGVELTVKDKRQQQELEAFFLTDVGRQIRHANEDFAAFALSAGNQTPLICISEYRRTIHEYDDPLTLEQAALELYVEPETLKNAIAYYSQLIGPKPGVARLSGLAHGLTVNRLSWEGKRLNGKTIEFGTYAFAVQALATWRKSK